MGKRSPPPRPEAEQGLRVLFLHPDLGIGGAERLVVDAAIGMQRRGHRVKLITSHHNPQHCFPETVDGTLEVEVRGDWLPRRFPVVGGGWLLFAILRQLYACLWVLLAEDCDLIFVDQLSTAVPLLRWLHPAQPKVLFYCHFPDQLLVQTKGGWLKRLYRTPLDWLEEWSTGMADSILVNSRFTGEVFSRTFTRLHARGGFQGMGVDVGRRFSVSFGLPVLVRRVGVVPQVLYPAIDFAQYDAQLSPKAADDTAVIRSVASSSVRLWVPPW